MEGAACPVPPKHTPQISGCDVQFLWHFVCVCGAMALRVHGSVCDYKHDWAPAASNKDTVAMGFVRGTAMVDFHIHGRVEKKWFGLGLAVLSVPDNESVKKQRPGSAGVGTVWLGHREGGEFGRFSRGAWEINSGCQNTGLAWLGFSGGGGLGGKGAACPVPPKHTPQISGCDVQFLWHFVCVCGAMALRVHGSVCDYKHDWAPAASNKDTVAMGFVRGTAMVDFHIHGRVEKKWFGLGLAVLSVPDNESVKNSGLARLGSDRVGLATERVGNSGDSAGGLGR